MTKFKSLWYTGLAIVGIPAVIVITIITFVVVNQVYSKPYFVEEPKQEQPKIDTVIVEKRVVVRDTVYIKPKIKPTPVAPVNDSI